MIFRAPVISAATKADTKLFDASCHKNVVYGLLYMLIVLVADGVAVKADANVAILVVPS